MRFASKVDLWIGALLAVAPVMSLAGGLVSLAAGQPLGLLSPLFVGAIYGGLVFPIYYEIGEDALVIRFGLARSRIPYAKIQSVKPTRNPLSSPALSLDRLHVHAGSALGPNISPKDKAAFLAALAPHVPHLRLQGDALLPA